jgi:hypothetical protein
MTSAKTATPINDARVTGLGCSRSDNMPPRGRAITAAIAKPAVRVPASVRSNS